MVFLVVGPTNSLNKTKNGVPNSTFPKLLLLNFLGQTFSKASTSDPTPNKRLKRKFEDKEYKGIKQVGQQKLVATIIIVNDKLSEFGDKPKFD